MKEKEKKEKEKEKKEIENKKKDIILKLMTYNHKC